MPKVGKMTFPYTAKGKAAAKKAAYKTGEKMEMKTGKTRMAKKTGMKKMGKKK
jgi:hypothetical protein